MSQINQPTPSPAQAPTSGRVRIMHLAKSIWTRIGRDEVTNLSTSFAYFWVFAIPPVLILIVMIGALANQATDVPVVEHLRELIQDRVSSDMRPLLLNLVDNAVANVSGNTAGIGAVVTAALALWSASSAVSILVVGFNRAYSVPETRGFLPRRLRILGLTLLLGLAVNLAVLLLVFGQRIGTWTADRFGLGSLYNTVWSLARWPIGILGVVITLSFLYWAGPDIDLPFRLVSPGAVVATGLWLAFLAGFGTFLSHSNPGSAYGVVGSVIVLLVFLNITGIVFFLGAEIDASLYEATQNTAHAAPHLGNDPLPILADG